MDMAAWLKGLGLGQYVAAFRDAAIDAEVLPELTDEHLKDSGCRSGTGCGSSRRSRPWARAGPRIPRAPSGGTSP